MASLEHLVDINRETGELVQGWERIRQSIFVILTTRLRMRLMRLWWGSEFMNLQDKPDNEQSYAESIFAAALAINKYEPEFKVRRIEITNRSSAGSPIITVEGVDLVQEEARRAVVPL